MKKIFTFIFVLFLFVINSFAQNTDHNHIKTCYSTEVNKKFIEANNLTDYYNQREIVYKEAANKYIESLKDKSINAIRTITVVVHVIYNSASTDVFVSDAEINEIINILNEDYTRTNPDVGNTRTIFSGVTGDAQINFCLAQTDPNGNPTTGIIRIDTDEDYFDVDTEGNEMKLSAGTAVPGTWPPGSGTTGNGDPAWDPNTYMNIWICNITDGAGGGTAGYAYLPATAGEAYDGLVLDGDIGVGIYAGQPNRTATHEIGHYLGLEHTWGDGGCSVDDGFADTPTSADDNIYVSSCGYTPEPNTCTDLGTDLPDQYENYMSYATCQNMFSAEQIAYMNGVVDTDRPGIIDNGLCGTLVPLDADFYADITTANIGQNITFTDASVGTGITSWTWDFGGVAATPPTDATSGPVVVSYNATGTYTVKLTIGDGTTTDIETKIDYITIIDPNALQFDFTGTPTTVVVGAGVDFSSTVIANGPITTWNWSFSGADIPTSNAEFPTGITWSTPGDYDVSLMAYSANDTQTVSKIQYIHVIDSNSTPIPDFIASATVIIPGTTIDYTNLTTNYALVDSSRWILAGATAPNDDIVIFEPSTVEYLNPGYYDATLIIYNNVLGNDTLTKTDYIYVLDTNNLSPCYARFRATTPRLIPAGSSVSFETIDDEIGDAQYFEWAFEGGTPATWTGQVPPAINYPSTEGAYDVSLKVWNDSGASDSLTKEEYVIVVTQWPWPDPDGFCDDELTNMGNDLSNSARHLTNMPGGWGYFPGHNHLKVQYYAERFTNYTFDKIRAININTSRIYNASNNYNEVTFYVWNVDSATGMPDSILGSKTQLISDFSQGITFPVTFDPAVEVYEEYYVGFRLRYPSSTSGEPQDTFAVYYSGNRPNGPNTVVCAKTTSNWMTPTDMLGDTLEMSLDLSIKACIIKVEKISEYADEISLYPNPTKGKVTVDIGDLPFINPELLVYDITGRIVDVRASHIYGNTYELDFRDKTTGIYLVTFNFDGVIVTKKLTLIK